jgi:hypothetical protein
MFARTYCTYIEVERFSEKKFGTSMGSQQKQQIMLTWLFKPMTRDEHVDIL